MEVKSETLLFLSLLYISCGYSFAGEYSHENAQDGQRQLPQVPEELLGYSFDVCNFPEISIACPPKYVVTDITTEFSSVGYCGCFRMDIVNMAKFLKARCLGSVSCKAADRELKIYEMYMNHPPGNCGLQRRIRYTCEPAQSLCEDDGENSASYYSNHINLLSPNYPNSYYPGNQRPPLKCATQISAISEEESRPTPNSKMNVMLIEMNLLSGEYVARCHNDTLHIGATYEDLGHEPSATCEVAGQTFQIETRLNIVFHYHVAYQNRRGALLKVSGDSPKSTIEVKYVDYHPRTAGPTVISTAGPAAAAGIPPWLTTTTSSPLGRDVERISVDDQPEGSAKVNNTVVEDTRSTTPSVKHPYKGSTLTIIVVISVVLVLLVFLLAALCLWRRRHSSWKSAISHAGSVLGYKSARPVSIHDAPARLSSRPSSGSTINPYAYSATYPPMHHYTEPLGVYVNTGNPRTSGYRGSDIYDDVQAQRTSLVCKEPPYDNHIMVKALKQGELETCPLKKSVQISVRPGGSKDKIEDLYSKPLTVRKKPDDDGYDSSNSAGSMTLQEGENLLVENELYHAKNQSAT